jgi:DNA-binding MarR family transcriptional regulator
MSKRDDLEHRALKIVIDNGPKGILQCELWRKLNASSREGSRISIKLEKKGLIVRKRELSEGRWTYRLLSKSRPISIDSIFNIPCVICNDILKCSAGNVVSPNECKEMNDWLLDIEKTEISSEKN